MLRTLIPSGRKFLLLAFFAGLVGGVWWWLQPHPPRDPVYRGQRLSAWIFGPEFNPGVDPREVRQRIHGYGLEAITWLAWQAEHGRNMAISDRPLPFQESPNWLRRWMPEKWGGLRPSGGFERYLAVIALHKLGPEAAPAIPALIRSLNNDAREIDGYRENLAQALNAMGAASWPAVQEALDHGSSSARAFLVETLQIRLDAFDEIGIHDPATEEEVKLVAEAFTKALADPDAYVRGSAIFGVMTCQDMKADVLPDSVMLAMFRCLSDPDEEVRGRSAGFVSKFKAKAEPAIPRLIELLADPQQRVRSSAARSLGELKEQRAVPRLRTLLDDPECRDDARAALAKIGAPLSE